MIKKGFIFLIAAYAAMEIDESGTDVTIGTFSVQNILWGVLGLFALLIIIVGLLWKCVVSPILDLTWDTATAALWIVVISLMMTIFTLMLWFIT